MSVYPPRIVLSPKALSVAGALLPSLPAATASVSDAGLAAQLGIAPNTAYYALQELVRHGAITYGKQARGGVREITLIPSCWVWAATAQVLSATEVS